MRLEVDHQHGVAALAQDSARERYPAITAHWMQQQDTPFWAFRHEQRE